jgi:hypothetical protein
VRLAGSTFRKTVRAYVVDQGAFVKAVAEGKIPADTLEVSQSKLNEYYKNAAPMVAHWPGIEIKEEVIIARK